MDDEELILKTAVRILQYLGYEAEAVRGGSEAVEKFKEFSRSGRPFAAVILDLTVKGGMCGRETLEELKALIPLSG